MTSSTKPDLTKYGVKPLAVHRRRMIVATQGPESSGKTNLIRSMPPPILYLNFDWNSEGVLDDLIEDGTIDEMIIRMDPLVIKQEQDVIRAGNVMKAWKEGCRSGYYRSGCIDTGGHLWELFCRAEFGRLDKIPPLKRKAPNNHMRFMFQQAKAAGMNMLVTHRLKDEYTKNEEGIEEKTGKKVRRGWNDDHLNYEAQVILEHFKDKRKPGLDKFGIRFLKCTANTNLEGGIMLGEEITWTNIGLNVFPLSTEKEWV